MAGTEKVEKWLQERVPVDLDKEDIKELENSKDESTAQAGIETAKTIQHTALLDITHAIT